MDRRTFIRSGTGAAMLTAWGRNVRGTGSGRPLNLLFIITDQQRFDALSCAGNSILQTPNLDRLAKEGTRFENAYTVCPVCAPARASILAGHDIFATGVPTNAQAHLTKTVQMPTFDNVLSDAGYWTGYVGKWHSTMNPSRRPYQILQGLNLQKEMGIPRALKDGEQYDITFTQQVYTPDPIDRRYGWSPGEIKKNTEGKPLQIIQPDCHGRLEIPVDKTVTALQAKQVIDALNKVYSEASSGTVTPFSLTCSLHFPHAPMLLPNPYYNMYPAKEMPLPVSIDDPMENSPYKWNWGRGDSRYRQDMIRYMISNYYGLVKEIDDWVGRILDTLQQTGFENNTLVIFTSDHGEMLGDHGMREKNVFYEGSAHIPLIMRLPGQIPAGQVIHEPVSQIDLFSTILDYLGQPAPSNHGRSLRPLIDGTDRSGHDFVVQEWPVYGGEGIHFTHFGPNFMVRTDEWKFMFASTPESTALDALYNLHDDPLEMTNLLGSRYSSDFVGKSGMASLMKDRLVAWLEQIDSPSVDGVKDRPVKIIA